MQIIERFTASAKGDLTEDLIIETPHFFAVVDGVTASRPDWRCEGKTMGQYAACLVAETLQELPGHAKAQEFAGHVTAKIKTAQEELGLSPIDRLAATAIVLPRRRPLEVWSIGDGHIAFKAADGSFHAHYRHRKYADSMQGFRTLYMKQEIAANGMPDTDPARAALIAKTYDVIKPVHVQQMLLANHPDPQEEYGYGVLCTKHVPPHHLDIFTIPEDAAEIVMCSDGLPAPVASAEEAQILLAGLKREDPLLLGNNRLGFTGMRGGFADKNGRIADVYDDVAYLRIRL